jgi:hypothetical protein
LHFQHLYAIALLDAKEFAMRKLLIFTLFSLLLSLTIGIFVSDAFHQWGQTSSAARDIVMTVDLFDFMANGGGYIGASHNYFGWAYAKATNNPDRSWWHKVLFWPNPYYLTQPPKEWPYPLLFEKG